MSIALLFNPSKRPGKIGRLQLEAKVRETHHLTARVTSEPIEGGASISDHMIVDNDEVTMEGVVTNGPVNPLGEFLEAFNDDNHGVVQATFDYLYALRDNRQFFDLVTVYKVYKNMVISDLSIPFDNTTGQSIRFTVTCKQVPTVRSHTVRIPREQVAAPDSRKDNAQSSEDLGQKSTQQASDDQDESALYWAFFGD